MPFSEAMRTAVALRFPVFDREQTSARERLEMVEDHVLACGYWHGELLEERLELRAESRQREHEWDHLEGWETYRRNKTEAAVDDAKRQLRPDLYDALQADKATLKDLGEQIDRLDREHDKVSRLYSIMTGA